MLVTDVSTFVGPYPFRHLGRCDVGWLLAQMDRLGIDAAWVGYLPAVLHQDPAESNVELIRLLEPHRDRLSPTPALNPALPRWTDDLDRARDAGAPAVRLFPQYQGIEPAGAAMQSAYAAAAAAGIPALLTVRLEDSRQRHPLDEAPDLPAAAVRRLVRSDPRGKLLVTHAGRAFVEEVHFGSTSTEAARILWDISWIWGPPEDDLALLLQTIGAARFTLGTGMPLRIPDTAFAKLDLLEASDEVRPALTDGSLARWRGS